VSAVPAEVREKVTSAGLRRRLQCRNHRDMFRFSAKHAIMPMTELYPMKEVNQALDRLRQNRVRYRAVLASES